MRNSNVFLDKLCIHQGDETIKMAGIKDLSRCLQISKTLTVLCSQDYFERLWCVYEIAQCASGPRAVAAGGGGTTDSSGRAGANTGGTVVEILPTWVAPFLLSMLLTNVAVMFFAFLLQSSPLYLAVLDTFGAIGGICIFWGIVGFAPAIISCSVVRDEVVGHSHSCHAIANFDLDKTKVTFESDREIVLAKSEASGEAVPVSSYMCAPPFCKRPKMRWAVPGSFRTAGAYSSCSRTCGTPRQIRFL